MTLVSLVLLLVSGHVTVVLVEETVCEATVRAVRAGERVTLEDDTGRLHEVEQARCILDFKKEIGKPMS